VNTGGGGGGGGATPDNGGAGAKGVVIVRQAISNGSIFANTTGSPTIVVTATHYIYIFNDSGTIEWVA
jgi:hypothetical protein